MTNMKKKKQQSLSSRISKYSLAAASATAAAVTTTSADADLVFLDLSGSPVFSNSSLETFVDILPFAPDATAISIATSKNSQYAANPLAPNSEFMIRGVGAFTGVRGNNGNVFSAYTIGNYFYLSNVGAVGNRGAGNLISGTPGASLTMYFDGYGGPFAPDTPGVAYMQFTNTQTGQIHDAWLDLVTTGAAAAREVQLTGITVDTTAAIPEPASGMALLCLGAIGIAGYRRRRTG
jgi:hypothetical protein